MPNFIWIPRDEWGSLSSTETFIQNRTKVPALSKTSIHVHHTANIDNDDTPNRRTKAEAIKYMQALQWVRPELGPLPYNDNVCVSEDAETVWVFEGRGALVLGAHAANHNYSGYGIGIFGNFDKGDTKAAKAAVAAIEWRVQHLIQGGMTNLGTKKNPNGWNAWGHRDSSTKTCPGSAIYSLLENFSLEEEGGEDNMLPINKDSSTEDIRHVQEMLGVTASGKWDFVTQLKDLAVRSSTGDPLGKNGTHVNGRMYTRLLKEYTQGSGDHDHDGRYLKSVTGEK